MEEPASNVHVRLPSVCTHVPVRLDAVTALDGLVLLATLPQLTHNTARAVTNQAGRLFT
jgi:hypothetical protein